MTKMQNAYNEFIADFCERHGECQATRDEAHEIADRMSDFGTVLGLAAKVAGLRYTEVEYMIEAVDAVGDVTDLVSVYARDSYDA
jgi:hypothetical protein